MKQENIADIYKLTPIQQGMLFHSLHTPNSGMYFEQFSSTLNLDLNVPVFRRAWQYVINQHAILRTAFFWEDLEEPLQVVRQQAVLPFRELDWSKLSAEEQEIQLEAYLHTDRDCAFDLMDAPLMRVAVIKGGSSKFYIVWSYHHLLLDGWSVPLVLQDVFIAYEAFLQRRIPSLSPRRPYRDYLTWLRKQDLKKAQYYWQQLLHGFHAVTPLPVDRVPGSIATSNDQFRNVQLEFSTEATSQIQVLARQERLTVNTLVLGAWTLLLHHYSGECDLVVGVTVSGRPAELAGSENMVGCLINTLPLRIQVRSDLTLHDWLHVLQKQQADLRQYEYTPLIHIHRWSEVARGGPLFESIVVFENYPADMFGQSNNLRIHQQTNYPLTLIAVPQPLLTLRIGYKIQRFEAATVDQLLEQLQMILENMHHLMDRTVTDIDMLTPAEHTRLLVAGNANRQPLPPDQRLHTLFDTQARRTPHTVALVYEDQQITYGELYKRTNLLAWHLRKLGVGPEVLVGVCLERGIDLIVALLAVLKAGGVYVPLDPGYPRDRVQFMIADAQVAMIVTQSSVLVGMLADSIRLLSLDTDWSLFEQTRADEPTTHVHAMNLAYLIYTSGSTGRPKGVAITHQNVVALIHWALATYTAADLAQVAASTSICFDLSIFEIFVPLSIGGTVRLINTALDIPMLDDITLINTVPSVMTELLRSGSLPTTTRVINLAGEPLSRALADDLNQAAPTARLYNLYGPSEDTTYSTCKLVDQTATSPPSIGRPIANTQAYVLNAGLQPVCVGGIGELYLGGAGLAREYFGLPALTAECFIPNPFSTIPGERLYRTGDLARYLPNGEIDFLGRRDQQVKLRGFRIELGEIEAVLRQYPGIQEAVVVVHQYTPDDKRLIAYVVARQAPNTADQAEADAGRTLPGTSDLRQFLQARLPAYMLPNTYVLLDRLPLTPSGKIDRRQLLVSSLNQPALETPFVEPRTEVEQTIAEIWKKVLHLDQVGVHDNFFDLGGHSLLVVQVHAELSKSFNKNISLVEMFRQTTINLLAGYFSQDHAPQNSVEHTSEPDERMKQRIEALNRKSRYKREGGS